MVLFHLGMPIVPGGYVGVDIFFIISGFLITNQLLKEGIRQTGHNQLWGVFIGAAHEG